MKKIILMLVLVIVLTGIVSAFDCGTDTVQDIDGNTYNTIAIGSQCWLAENMRTTKYPDGSSITKGCASQVGCDGTGPLLWGDDTSLYSCPPNASNNEEDCAAAGGSTKLGMFYQWSAAMDGSTTEEAQGICPSGWHIPTHDEWTTLELEVCGSETCAADFPYDTATIGYRGTDEGDRLKTADACVGGSNCGVSGFEIFLAGVRTTTGTFSYRDHVTSVWLSTESGSNAWGRRLYSNTEKIYRNLYTKALGFPVRCLQNPIILPTYTNFTSEETTNFSEVTLSSVTSLTLAIDNKGKIAFPSDHNINAENENYDLNVKIEDSVIFVNSSALDSSFNSSATLTFYNVDCNKPYVFYSETASTFAAILSENQRCPDSLCSNIQCNGNTLTVDVAHFTGFAAGADANLTTEAEAGVFSPLDPIEFTAEYINSTDGTPISGECNITFDEEGTWHTMDFNSPDYNYTRSFAAAGLHEYNVTCSSANFVTLEANDTKVVTATDIPEFSLLTLGFGLIAVLGGLVVMRKKR